MDPGAWAFVLLLLAVLLVLAEVFVPAMGALASLAVAAVIAAVFMAYRDWGLWGAVGFLGAAAVGVPSAVALALYFWPHAALGNMLASQPPPMAELEAEVDELRRLVGQRGVTRSKMLPSGGVRIAGKMYDAASEGAPIDEGQLVVVIAVRMNRLVVRPLALEPAGEPRVPQPLSPDEVLAQPIDQLGIEPIERPAQ